MLVTRWWEGGYGLRGQLLHALLAPAEMLFRMAVWLRNRAYDAGVIATTRIEIPVVSVGNLTIGGAGKTPVARWVVDELLRRGYRPAVLHGGYAEDEPQLHRSWHPDVPVFAEKDRIAAARRAVACGATVVVLDDGFQHRRISKDLEILLIAAETWTAHPKLLPRGPWREGPGALRRADVIAVTRKTGTPEASLDVVRQIATIAPGASLASVFLRPCGWHNAAGQVGHPDGPVLGVVGIASPALFTENARALGADVTEVVVFPDHHEYSAADIQRIRVLAGDRSIITTAKDQVKLSALQKDAEVWVLDQDMEIELGNDVFADAFNRLTA
jgi:tetraacyldisaccharide 4'-kinase